MQRVHSSKVAYLSLLVAAVIPAIVTKSFPLQGYQIPDTALWLTSTVKEARVSVVVAHPASFFEVREDLCGSRMAAFR